jgi:polyhydroxybutyrate depolymerase
MINMTKSLRLLKAFCGFLLFISNTSFAQTTIVDSFLHGGIYRSYRIYVPAINDGSKNVPLIVNMHGLGSNALEQESYGDFRPIADTANFILVHPNGANVVLTTKGWNTFNAIGSGTNDVDFISKLIDTIAKKYKIDLNRVYATGMSNGGFMSYELACFLSSKIAAIASVTGSMTEERRTSCNATHPTPLMEIHGTSDNVVGYDGTNYLSIIPAFTHIDSLMKYWFTFNGCTSLATKTILPNVSTADGCTAEHYVWNGGKLGSTVEHYKIIGGGHTWPGASITTGVTNQDFNASKEIWRFFSQYQLTDLLSIDSKATTEISNLNIYPNPVQAQLNVEVGNNNKEIEVSLMDGMGRVLFLQQYTQARITIERNNISAGLYYLQVKSSKAILRQKVIFQ